MTIPATREQIRLEIQHDPATMGYHAVLAADPNPDEAIWAMMNDALRGQPISIPRKMTLADLWNALPSAVASSIYNKFIDANFRAVQPDANLIYDAATRNAGGVDWGDGKAQAVVLGLFQKNRLTQAEYDAIYQLTHRAAARSENLWGQDVLLAGSPDSVRGALYNDDGSRWSWT